MEEEEEQPPQEEVLKYIFPKKLKVRENKKQKIKGRPYLPIIAPDYSYVMDLFFFKNYDRAAPEQIRKATRMYIASRKRNKDLTWDYKNIIGAMIVIETTSRKIWCYPITGKKAEECMQHFYHFLEDINYNITNLTSDNGKEFSLIKQYNDKHHLFYYRQVSVIQGYHLILSRVDRGVRTVKELLKKHFFEHPNDDMINALDTVVSTYNRTKHNSLYYWTDAYRKDTGDHFLRKQYLNPNLVFENPHYRKYVKITNYVKRNENYKEIDKIKVDGQTEYYYRIYNPMAFLNKGPKDGWLSTKTITLIDRIGNSFKGSNGKIYNYYDLIPKEDGDIYLQTKYGHKSRLEQAVEEEYQKRKPERPRIVIINVTELKEHPKNYVTDRLNELRDKEGLSPDETKEKRRLALLNYKGIMNVPINKEIQIRKEILEYEKVDNDEYNQLILGLFNAIILKIEEQRNKKLLSGSYINSDDEKFDNLIYENFKRGYFLHEKKMSPVAKAMRNSLLTRISRKTFPEDDGTRFTGDYVTPEMKFDFSIQGDPPIPSSFLRHESNRREDAIRNEAEQQADENNSNSVVIHGRPLRKRRKKN